MTAAQDFIQSITLVSRDSESGDYAPALHPWSSQIPGVGQCAHGIRADRDGRLSHLWGSVMRLGTVLDRFVVVQPDEKEILADKPAPQLTRSHIVQYFKVGKNTVPDYQQNTRVLCYTECNQSSSVKLYRRLNARYCRGLAR